jgi:D-sedoheptulose 7-phosphate isomerase
MEYQEMIRKYIRDEIDTLNQLDPDAINEVMNAMLTAYENGNTIYVFGNGGSSSTASHFQNDFNKGVSEHTEKKFNFICLNDNIPTIMAIANDISFDEIFRFQLRGHLKPGDLIFAISGSGNSKNVLNAVEYAKECGNKIVAITGFDGGKLDKLADFHLHVPVMSMQITEDIHIVFDHMMMSIFNKTLAGIEHMKG